MTERAITGPTVFSIFGYKYIKKMYCDKFSYFWVELYLLNLLYICLQNFK